ncbi:sigma factor [Paenibacillus cremeus]|nr:sigma factor [Paenibacillus cremeus]
MISPNLAHPLSSKELNIMLQDVESNKTKLIEHSLRYVVWVASKYEKYEDIEDLIQIGCIGLIIALHNMEGIGFEQYYYHVKEYVRCEIERYIENKERQKTK